MFNLGSKKQSASSVWNIKLLTKEYLVEGTFHPKEYELGGDNVFALAATSSMNEGGIDAFQRLRLFNTHIQPTGNLISNEQSFSEWSMLTLNEVVAIIPNDETSLETAKKAFNDYRHPLEVLVYSGTYRIHAKLLSDTASQKQSLFAMTGIIPLTDAKIDCQLPGAKLKNFSVPWLLLNAGASLHGCGILAQQV